LSPGFVQRWESHIINIHPSILPEFKGAGAIKQALDAGISETGVTIHYVDKGMDTGSIIEQQRVPIYNNDSLEDLEQRIHEVEHKLYPRTIKWLLTNY
jgi:phosphoribosylglycinamide formyltransferase-1